MNRAIEGVLRKVTGMASSLRVIRLILKGARFGNDVFVESEVDCDLGGRWGKRGSITIGTLAHLSRGVILHCFGYGGAIYIGERVFVGPYTVIYGHGNVRIGHDTLIAMHCRILSSNHDFSSRELIRSRPDLLRPVSIGSDVWIGAGATILGGVTIQNGAVVGAGAVVSRDVGSYEVVAGIPAKVIATRV